MFSPKVLDRANVIEFRVSKAEISEFLSSPNAVDMESLAGGGAAFGEVFVVAANNRDISASTIPESIRGTADVAKILNDSLLAAFEGLADIGAEFGFRTAYEINRFVYFHAVLSGAGWQFKDALDAQVFQKLLPKLHGSERRLGPVLEKLEKFCTERNLELSLEKIKRMRERLKDGFTSFAEA
jgi:5-methylcytosine-specific restriction endonuclease McrBC GTP-binding regulatory subunit McrB